MTSCLQGSPSRCQNNPHLPVMGLVRRRQELLLGPRQTQAQQHTESERPAPHSRTAPFHAEFSLALSLALSLRTPQGQKSRGHPRCRLHLGIAEDAGLRQATFCSVKPLGLGRRTVVTAEDQQLPGGAGGRVLSPPSRPLRSLDLLPVLGLFRDMLGFASFGAHTQDAPDHLTSRLHTKTIC